MKYKKQFVIALCCIILLSGIFLAVSYLGDNYSVFNFNKTNEKNTEVTAQESNTKEAEEKANTTEENKNVTEDKNEASQEKIKEGYYTVKSNDTLYSIARTYMPNYDSSKIISKIRERNNLKEDQPIITGEKLIITYETDLVNEAKENSDDKAKAEEKAKTEEKANTEKTNAEENSNSKDVSKLEDSNHIKYTVKSGDTLYSIASEYLKKMDVVEAVNKIKQENELKTDVIKVDETLYLPVEQ